MASTTNIYDAFRKYVLDGTIDLDTDTLKVALITSAYTYSAANTVFANVSANEVANGAGYATGGVVLANSAVTYTGATGKWAADNPIWASLTKTFRFALIYKVGTANSLVNPLIACVLLDNTPADVVVSAADYSIQWNAAGIITLS